VQRVVPGGGREADDGRSHGRPGREQQVAFGGLLTGDADVPAAGGPGCPRTAG
jgi:hypothetical protein